MAEWTKRAAVRLSDVAKLAQCSAATVSRVLNAPETVNAEARARVERAVRELGYMRNGAARALRSRRSQIVGVIIPSIGQQVFADFISVLQSTLARRSYSLIVTTSNFDLDQELMQGRLLAERGVDGLVLIGHNHRPEMFTLLAAQELPYVMTYTYVPALGRPAIGFDNFAAMKQVVEHLEGLGHRAFGMVTGPQRDNDRMSERVKGVAHALETLGLRLSSDRVVEVGFTIEGGRAALRHLLALGRRPTALICTSDVMACGVLIEAAAQGIVVPDDLSVTGFDNLEMAAHCRPALTTVAIPSAEIGRLSGEYLLARIAGRTHDEQIPIAAPLILRDTTAPPPRRLAGGAEG